MSVMESIASTLQRKKTEDVDDDEASAKNALKKRNAALNEFLQASRQNMDVNASPLANGSGEPSSRASVDGNGELEKRDGPENDGDKGTEKRAENGFHVSQGTGVGSKERAEEESERRKDRKRKREEDSREESGRCIDAKEDFAKRDVGDLDASFKGKSRVSPAMPEPMNVDTVDQRVAMDCDVQVMGNSPIDETVTELVRVPVSEVGTGTEMESKEGFELGLRDASDAKVKEVGNSRRNGEVVRLEATGTAVSNFEETKSPKIQVPTTTEENGRDDRGGEVAKTRGISEASRKKEELEAKLERLRAEKHRFVIRLKQVLHEEELKKRGSLASGSASLSGAATGSYDMTVMSVPGEKRGFGGSHTSADLEDGELEYARTPSPPLRAIPNIHGGLSSHGSLGPPSLVTASGRQTSLSQHLSQSATGRGGYYASGLGIPTPPAAPGISGGGSLSPGTSFIGNLPSTSLSTHSYSHSLALQHAAAIHAQKISPVAQVHGQFSPIPPSGGPGGAIAGGPPGFGGYAISSSVHSHHSHLSQSTSSSLPHIAGQQGVGSSSLLATPRGPPGYHDIRLGSGTWIQR